MCVPEPESKNPAPESRPYTAQGRLYLQGILFTGHMIDAPGREPPRFPACAEPAARRAIASSLAVLLHGSAQSTIGIAGGASGGDILFHELCAERGIPTRMLLALPPDEYIENSVAQADANWTARFRALVAHLGPGNVCVMQDGDGLLGPPHDLSQPENLWQRANLWMLQELLRLASERTLLALWDGKGGDGPGGTGHLVQIAAEQGIRIAPIISVQCLLGSGNES